MKAWLTPAGLGLLLTQLASQAAALEAPPAPSLPASFLRVFGGLAVVLGLFAVGVWLARNGKRTLLRNGRPARLKVLEVCHLGQRQAIYVIGYDQQRLLVSTSTQGVQMLTTLPEDANDPLPPVADASFSANFLRLLQPGGHQKPAPGAGN
jgi:flagellar biogenesis protein FliO